MHGSEQYEFLGTERFLVEGELGSGGFGVVYRAYDRERHAAVALKTLPRVDPELLYRFKQEFRSLADIAHPNLVSLYELIAEGDEWFFTMELLEGTTLLDFVRSGGVLVDRTTEILSTFDASSHASGSAADRAAKVQRQRRPVDSQLDFNRLREAFVQLSSGVHALHTAGKLHRDIKPTNVIVTDERRVVLLDFGLVAELWLEAGERSSGRFALEGTPAYMSPEQASGERVTEASDWYSVGVMLFEALTGELPFDARSLEVLALKNRLSAPAAGDLVSEIPSDLDRLCSDLLERDARKRPAGEEILVRLRGRDGAALRCDPVRTHRFVGRERQRRQLADVFSRVERSRRASVVFLSGRPGMGKSALMREFFADVRQRASEAILLTGRCYERESLPYKALDSAIDSLTRQMRLLRRDELAQVLPEGVHDLSRLFPVLRRIDFPLEASVDVPPDLQELKRRAVAALRELLHRLTTRATLVLAIDDVQWGDLDSALLLSEILRQSNPPPLLLLVTFRPEERSSRFAQMLSQATASRGEIDFEDVILDELSPGEARQFVSGVTGLDVDDRRVARIAAESGGNPLFIEELVTHLLSGGEDDWFANLRLEDVILARVSSLPSDSRRLLETIAVAGHPLDQEVAKAIAGVERTFQSALATLRARHMVRLYGSGRKNIVEIYHDRIRETIVAAMERERLRETLLRLAFTLQAVGYPEVETIGDHYLAGGDSASAYVSFRQAAEHADGALAFDRAATLYRMAIELSPVEGAERQRLRVRLAEALANGGRGAEAGVAYAAAVATAADVEAIELQRRAAEQFLRSGHIDDGIAQIRSVLAHLHLSLAPTARRAFLSFLLRRLLVRLRGLRYRKRSADEIAPEMLARIDTCWSVAMGLALVDTFRGADFQGRHMLLALRVGEPYRLARALAMEAGYSSANGWPSRKRTALLLGRARDLAGESAHPHAVGLVEMVDGVTSVLEGRWNDGLDRCGLALPILRERCSGVAWELFNSEIYALLALMWIGRYGEMARRIPLLTAASADRGDLYAETYVRSALTWVVKLAADDPDGALSEEQDAIASWSQSGYHIQHYHDLLAGSSILLYRGRGVNAYERLLRGWPDLRRSMLLTVQIVRVESRFLKARCAMAAAVESGSKSLLRRARREVAKLRHEDAAWSRALGAFLEGGLAVIREKADAADRLADAERLLAASNMRLHVAVAQRERGLLTHDGDLIEQAEERMKDEGIRRPDRFSFYFLPTGMR